MSKLMTAVIPATCLFVSVICTSAFGLTKDMMPAPVIDYRRLLCCVEVPASLSRHKDRIESEYKADFARLASGDILPSINNTYASKALKDALEDGYGFAYTVQIKNYDPQSRRNYAFHKFYINNKNRCSGLS